LIVIEPEGWDPYAHLALEEHLLDGVDVWGPSLLLWKSAPAVVIGKNQNPWRECHLPAMMRDGVTLARRISGGGAVYHDEGNLNYTVILPRGAYREDDVFETVLAGLTACGIQAERMNRNSLAVERKKISGSAFCYRRSGALHHGTMLLNTDLHRLRKYLGSTASDLETRAISSIPADVTNIGVDDFTLRQAWIEAFAARYGAVTYHGAVRPEWHSALAALREHHAGSEWIWNHTPAFTWRVTLPAGDMAGTVTKGLLTRLEGTHPGTSFYASRIVGQMFCLRDLNAAMGNAGDDELLAALGVWIV